MRTKTSLPISSRRGAARISAVWMIVVIVLLFVALGYAYIAQDDASIAQSASATAERDKVAAENLFTEARTDLSARSEVLGFTTDFATVPSNIEAAKSALENAKSVLPDSAGVETFEAILPIATKAYQNKVAQIAELNKTIETLRGQVSAERAAKQTLEGEKDQIIASLNQEKSDLEDSLKSELARVEDAKSELNSQLDSKTSELTAKADEARLSARAVEEANKAMASQRANYTRERKLIQKRSEKADGEISAVLSAYEMGIINLAASDRLSEGTVFNIVSGQPGTDTSKPKAKCLVTNVGPKFSEVEIFDVADPLGQPVVQGDKLYNALYEPKGQRYAVFAGNITGSYNKPELLLLFKEIGITVQEELTNTTDYLITGGPMFMDEEGEPLEEPLLPENLPAYTEAIDKGVTIIPVRDILQYFRR